MDPLRLVLVPAVLKVVVGAAALGSLLVLPLNQALGYLLHRGAQALLGLARLSGLVLLVLLLAEEQVGFELVVDGVAGLTRLLPPLRRVLLIVDGDVVGYYHGLLLPSVGGRGKHDRLLLLRTLVVAGLLLLGQEIVAHRLLADICGAIFLGARLVLDALSRPHRVVALLESLGDIEQLIDTCDLLLALVVVRLARGVVARLIATRDIGCRAVEALVEDGFLQEILREHARIGSASMRDRLELSILGKLLDQARVHGGRCVVSSGLLPSSP